jgi:hypothetical protein
MDSTAVRQFLILVSLAAVAAPPARPQTASAGASPQTAANGQANSGGEVEQQRRRLCGAALEQYVDHGGPMPPAGCSHGSEPPSSSAGLAPATPEAAAGYGRAATNCTTDLYGDRHCVTRIPGKPLIFTDCAPGSRDGEHCDPK